MYTSNGAKVIGAGAGYSAEARAFDRMLLGDRLAAMAAPGAARAVVPDTYLAPDGSGHLMPQAPVVVDGQSLTALPGLDHSGYFGPGFVTSSYQQAVGMAADRNAPWYERGMGLVAGTAMSPLMLVEEAGRAMLNVPYHARQAGQYAAQFKLATTTDERVLAGLNFLNNGASAIVGTAPAIPSSVSLRPVMTAQEMAVAQFPGAEATAAARATYGNTAAQATDNVAGMFRRTENVGDFADLKVPMQMRYVEQAAEDGGVGLQGVKVRIVRDPDLLGKNIYGYTHADGSIDIYPDAFTNTEQLVKTLGHERTHTMQIYIFGHPNALGDEMYPSLMLNERAAHGIEDSFWQYYLKNKSGKLEQFR